MPLITPDGNLATSIDKIMLLAMWSKRLSEEKHPTRPAIISAGMGKPTFPISQFATQSGIDYWSRALSKTQKARHLLSGSNDPAVRNRIAKFFAAIDYGDPRGDFEARTKMALALTRWYGNEVLIRPQDILYTVGGAGALSSIFTTINKQIPNGLIVTPFPHYSLYLGPQGNNRLFPIPVMAEKGYRLTALSLSKHLEAALTQASRENGKVSAILISDPNNPLGTALDELELQEMASVLKNYPDIFIILDEAYAEMRLIGKHRLSLLSVAPALKSRIILMRSATKALSAAGERMAVIVAFNEAFMANLTQENVNTYGHAPRSLQYVFAEAMENLDEIELDNLRNYYKPQVEYALTRLSQMGATMPEGNRYRPEGAFYVVADLKELYGQEISAETARALGKRGKITTDEELIYSLLFDSGVAVAPLSYFGLSNRYGYIRITCSGGESELTTIMDRLETQLIIARKRQQLKLEQQLTRLFEQLNSIDEASLSIFKSSIAQTLTYQSNPKNSTALELKNSNGALRKIILTIKLILKDHLVEIKDRAAINLQSFFRGKQGRRTAKQWKAEMDDKWRTCVNFQFSSADGRQALYHWPPSKRLTFSPWAEYLKTGNLPAPSEAKTVPSRRMGSRRLQSKL